MQVAGIWLISVSTVHSHRVQGHDKYASCVGAAPHHAGHMVWPAARDVGEGDRQISCIACGEQSHASGFSRFDGNPKVSSRPHWGVCRVLDRAHQSGVSTASSCSHTLCGAMTMCGFSDDLSQRCGDGGHERWGGHICLQDALKPCQSFIAGPEGSWSVHDLHAVLDQTLHECGIWFAA